MPHHVCVQLQSQILGMIENSLAHSDPELYRHFLRHKITTQVREQF